MKKAKKTGNPKVFGVRLEDCQPAHNNTVGLFVDCVTVKQRNSKLNFWAKSTGWNNRVTQVIQNVSFTNH